MRTKASVLSWARRGARRYRAQAKTQRQVQVQAPRLQCGQCGWTRVSPHMGGCGQPDLHTKHLCACCHVWLEINLGAPPSPAPQATEGLDGDGAMPFRQGDNSLMFSTAGCRACRFCKRRRHGVHQKNDITTLTHVARRIVLCCSCTGVFHTYGFWGIAALLTPMLHIGATSHSSPCPLMPLTGLAASCCRLPASAAVWGGYFESVLSFSLHGWPCVLFHAMYSRHALPCCSAAWSDSSL